MVVLYRFDCILLIKMIRYSYWSVLLPIFCCITWASTLADIFYKFLQLHSTSTLLVSQFCFVNYSPNLSYYLKHQSKNLINVTKFCLDAPYSLWWGGVIWVILMNCFCDTVDRQKTFSLISSWDHCQRSSHRKSLTCRKQGLNLHRTWVQA